MQTKQGVAGATWTMGPASILEFRFGGDYTNAGKLPPNFGDPTTGFTIPNQPVDPSLAGGLMSVGLSGFSSLGRQSSNPQYQDPLVLDPKVNYTRIVGRHSIKAGFEFQMINTAVSDFHPQYGTENFTGDFSDPVYFTNPSAINSLTSAQKQLYSLADFIYGAPSHYELDNNPVANYRQRMYFGYLQEDFKVSPSLTLNLGLRYEFATPQYEANNKLANFDRVNDTMIFASGGSLYDRSLVHPDYNNWAPRVGFAYQVDPKTTVRSGYGISYVQFNRMGGENLLAYNGPSIVDAAIDQIPTQGICASGDTAPGACLRSTAQGFPANFASPAAFNTAITEVRYIPGSNRTGYVQSWHFTLRRELAKSLLLGPGHLENYNGDNSRINYCNTPLEKGLSSYNQPVNDTFSVLYDLPFGKNRDFRITNNVEDFVAGGRSIDAINTMTSGLPLNITYSPTSQASISSLVTTRPNLVTGTSIYLK